MEENIVQKTVKMLDLGIDEMMMPKGKSKSDEEAIELLQ